MSVLSRVLARCAKFDSTLQLGLDNAFALIFGGKVVPAEIEALLKQEIEDHLQATDSGVVAPNVFHVGVAAKDMLNLQQTAPRLPQDFADQMARYCRNEGWTTLGRVVVVVAEESGLRSGQLRVSSYADAQPTESSRFDAITSAREDAASTAVPSAAPDIPPPAAATTTPAPDSEEVKEPEVPMDNQHQAPSPATAAPATDFFAAANPAAAAAAASSFSAPEQASAAWSSEPRLTVTLLLQDGSSRTYTLHEGSNLIGRGADCDFRLPDTGVSRKHAEITWDGAHAIAVDLHSTNGTKVNDVSIENWLLADGDVITVGHSHIEVRIVEH